MCVCWMECTWIEETLSMHNKDVPLDIGIQQYCIIKPVHIRMLNNKLVNRDTWGPEVRVHMSSPGTR